MGTSERPNKFGVVIVTYNRNKLLRECIACVQRQTRPFHTICVVDNHSTDGSGEFLDQMAGESRMRPGGKDSIRVYHLPENIGGAGGFAYGLKKLVNSDCDWILLIDDDAMLAADYMERIEERMTDPYAAYSGTVRCRGRIDTSHRRRLSNRWLMLYKPIGEEAYEGDSFPYDASTFCGLVVSRRVVKEIGFPREEYFIWLDDTEYSLRMRRFSRILNVNAAELNHKTNPTGKAPVIGWKNYYGFRNAIDIGRRYAPCLPLYYGYIYLNHVTHIVIDRILLLLGSKKELRRYRIQVYKDAIKDSLKKRQGKNEKYLPGTGCEYF